MATITTLVANETGPNSRIIINTNFANLNAAIISPPLLSIVNGGTGQTTANAALNAFLPDQTGNAGKVLFTDGANSSWAAVVGTGTVTSFSIVSANGFAGSVTAPTTAPALTLTTTLTTPVLAGNGTAIIPATTTGSGSTVVLNTSPTITTPSIAANKGTLTTDADGVTVTFDLNVSNTHIVTLGGNRTLALSNGATGQVFLLHLKQDGTGTRTVTWFAGILWAGGTVPTLTTTAGKTDTFGFQQVGVGAYYGYVIGQNL